MNLTQPFTLTWRKPMQTATRSLLIAATASAAITAGSADAALVLNYTFDDADIVGTKAQDDKVGANDSSETAAGTVTTGQAGVFGEAYSFNRTGRIDAPSGVVPSGASERTISIWFNQTESNTQNKIFGYGSGAAGRVFDVGLEGDGIRLRYFGGSKSYGSGFDFLAEDAGWHHLAVRVNSGASTFNDVDVFLDGTQLSTSSDTNAINTGTSAFGIGDGAAFQEGYTGLLDELRVYDNALTDLEIGALAVVPEPSSLALLGLGGLCVLRRRRG